FLWKKEKDAGWGRLVQISEQRETFDAKEIEKNRQAGALYSSMAIKIMMGTYAAIGVTMGILAFFDAHNQARLLLYGFIFILVSAIVLSIFFYRRSKLKNQLK